MVSKAFTRKTVLLPKMILPDMNRCDFKTVFAVG